MQKTFLGVATVQSLCVEEGFIAPESGTNTDTEKQQSIFNKLCFSHPQNYPLHVLMLKSHEGLSTVAQSKRTAKKQARAPWSLKGTEKVTTPKNGRRTTQSYVRLTGLFPQLIRKNLGLPST